jgi:hypothetical protein
MVRKYALKTHETAEWMISLADSKASVLAGAAAVFVALVFGQVRPSYSTPAGVLLIVGVALVGGSALSSLVCLWPRIDRPSRSELFYHAGNERPFEEYAAGVMSKTEASLVGDLVSENYALAKVQAAKYRALRAATALLVAGLPLVAIGWLFGAT